MSVYYLKNHLACNFLTLHMVRLNPRNVQYLACCHFNLRVEGCE